MKWWSRFVSRDRPCWLTIVGNSGTGKTHCASRIWTQAGKMLGRTNNLESRFSEEKLWWPKVIHRLRSGSSSTYEKLEDTGQWPLLVLDEIGASRDNSGFAADQLYFVLGQRENKWTVMTSNLTLEGFTKLDERITSRAFRNDGIVLEVKTQDFTTRVQ